MFAYNVHVICVYTWPGLVWDDDWGDRAAQVAEHAPRTTPVVTTGKHAPQPSARVASMSASPPSSGMASSVPVTPTHDHDSVASETVEVERTNSRSSGERSHRVSSHGNKGPSESGRRVTSTADTTTSSRAGHKEPSVQLRNSRFHAL